MEYNHILLVEQYEKLFTTIIPSLDKYKCKTLLMDMPTSTVATRYLRNSLRRLRKDPDLIGKVLEAYSHDSENHDNADKDYHHQEKVWL